MPIDYERMARVRRSQKSALTRAINSKDARRVYIACRDAVHVWEEIGAWPDDWSRWQRALDDALPFYQRMDLSEFVS
jgi:hypothetical protein